MIMDPTEQLGRFIHGMILQDEASNATPVGSSSQTGNAFIFTVAMFPEGLDADEPVVVRITVEIA